MPVMLIKHKIQIGFALLLVLMLVIAGLANSSLSKTEQTVSSVIELRQPLVLKAHRLNDRLAKTAGSLSTFLLTKNDQLRQVYQDYQKQAVESFREMQVMSEQQQDPQLDQQLQVLDEQLAVFVSYEERLIELASDPQKNQPALAFAATDVNPLSTEVLGILANMIDVELEEETTSERLEWINLMNDMRYNYAKVMNGIRLFLSDGDENALSDLNNTFSYQLQISKRMVQFEDLYTFEQEEGAELLNQLFARLEPAMEKMKQLNLSPQREMDVYLMNTEINPLLEKLQTHVSELEERQTGLMKSDGEALLDTVRTGITLQTILAVFALVAGGLIAIIIARVITVPLNKTVSALQQAAEGDGDLTRRLEVTSNDELGQLASAFNSFSERLQQLMQQVSDSSQQLIEAAGNMNQVLSGAQSDVITQNQQIEQISTAIETMVGQVQQITTFSGSAASLAEQTNQNSLDGRNVVQLSLQSSNQLAQDVVQAADVIDQLESDVEAISGVLDVIRGIAEQTNLLALNAAIEAARAGEQGRGFAVVADEVRTLASRTQESTEEIQNMIQRLQLGSQQAVKVMNQGKEKADEGLTQAQNARESLEQISAAAEEMLGVNRDIVLSASTQQEMTQQISGSLENINGLSEKTAAGASQLSKTGGQVNELAMQLQRLIQQFKV